MGGGVAAKDEQIAAGSRALLVLGPHDRPRDWIKVGRMHANILLAVTAAARLIPAYLNQPVEVDRLRATTRG